MRAVSPKVGLHQDAECEGASSLSGLVAPVTVAEIELTDPIAVSYVSIAEADCDEVRRRWCLFVWTAVR